MRMASVCAQAGVIVSLLYGHVYGHVFRHMCRDVGNGRIGCFYVAWYGRDVFTFLAKHLAVRTYVRTFAMDLRTLVHW